MQYFAGALAIKWLSSMIPVAGTVVNATVSLATVEAAGWAFHFIIRDGRNPDTMSKDELKAYFKLGKEQQKNAKNDFVDPNKLPEAVRKKYEALSKELTDTETTEARRQAILAEITDLLGPYR